MVYHGRLRGNQIELDEHPALPDGTRVKVNVMLEDQPRRGSPAALLRLVGTLSDTEAEAILRAAQECRRIDPSLWGKNP